VRKRERRRLRNRKEERKLGGKEMMNTGKLKLKNRKNGKII